MTVSVSQSLEGRRETETGNTCSPYQTTRCLLRHLRWPEARRARLARGLTHQARRPKAKPAAGRSHAPAIEGGSEVEIRTSGGKSGARSAQAKVQNVGSFKQLISGENHTAANNPTHLQGPPGRGTRQNTVIGQSLELAALDLGCVKMRRHRKLIEQVPLWISIKAMTVSERGRF